MGLGFTDGNAEALVASHVVVGVTYPGGPEQRFSKGRRQWEPYKILIRVP